MSDSDKKIPWSFIISVVALLVSFASYMQARNNQQHDFAQSEIAKIDLLLEHRQRAIDQYEVSLDQLNETLDLVHACLIPDAPLTEDTLELLHEAQRDSSRGGELMVDLMGLEIDTRDDWTDVNSDYYRALKIAGRAQLYFSSVRLKLASARDACNGAGIKYPARTAETPPAPEETSREPRTFQGAPTRQP